MDRSIAESLIQQFLSLDQPLNSATDIADNIADKSERENMHRRIADMIGKVYTDLILPIAHEYPDLDPEKPKKAP